MTNSFTYIDLFAGCGGLSLGLHQAGWKGLFAIERSDDAFLTLKHNLIDNISHFDWPDWLPKTAHGIDEIIKTYPHELKSLSGYVDLVAGGPPCQGFSVAGRRQEDDVRNGLINSYLKFVELVQPKFILFENVKGFTLQFKKNKSRGLIYSQYVLEKLDSLGYEVHGELIDFSQFGIPQKRTRFILVGVRKDVAESASIAPQTFFEMLIKNSKKILQKKKLPRNPTVASAISDLYKLHGQVETPDRKNFLSGVYGRPTSNYQRYLKQGRKSSIPDSHSFPHHKAHIEKRFKYLMQISEGSKNITNSVRTKLDLSKHTIIPLCGKKKAPTITTLPDDYIHYLEPRILTVREYARIQSFPDWYEFKGKYTSGGTKRVKEAPRYTQIGNAVPPLFSEQSGIVLKQLAQQ